MKKYFLGFSLFVFGLLLTSSTAFAASVGPFNPGSAVNTTGFGSTAWSNPSNITSVGSPYASVTLTPGSSSNYLKATNYGFNIPLSATIDGIEVKIDRKGEQNLGFGFRDDVLKLVKGGVISGDDKSSSNTYPTTLSTKTYGANNDKWGLSWTPADINASNFGVALSTKSNLIISTLTASINSIQVIVHYTLTTGNLQVTKNTIGGDSNFSFTGSGLSNFNITTVANTGFKLINNLTAGNYTVNETAQYGWDMTGNTCVGVAVTVGNTTNCTVTNTKRGSITVYKDVLNPAGDAVVDGHWFGVKLNDANPQSISEFNSYTYSNLVPGTYTITETADGDYVFGSFSIDADAENPGAQVVVPPGATTVLTITNKQKPATLNVIKVVDNSHGLGTSVSGDFTLNVDGPSASPSSFAGSTEGTAVTLYPGAYTVGETPVSGYAMGTSADCMGVIASNQTKTCTVTNFDLEPGKGAIILTKNVVNDNGGSDQVDASDFDLMITPSVGEAMKVSSGSVNQLMPGVYNVSEVIPSELTQGYMQTSFVCMNGESTIEGTSINLQAGEVYRCTITNDDKPAKLTIVKNLINNAWNPTLAETFTFSLSGQEDVSVTTSATEEGDIDATGQSEVVMLNAGNYTLSENLLHNWSLTGMYCSGEEGSPTEEGNGLMLSLSNGEEVTCYFTNTRQTGTLTINKIVINDHEGTNDINDFPGFQINGGVIIPFHTGNEEESEMESQTTVILESGVQYDVTEPESSGYDRILENNCRDINVDAGLTYVCDITNNDNANNSGGSTGGDPIPFTPSTGGQVLGASTEAPATTEAPKEEMPKDEGMVLGEEIFKFLKDMKLGSKLAPDVSELQKRLTKEGFYTGPISGYFGLLTKEAVIKYQTKNSPLTPDGVVGPRTRGVLNGTSAPLPNSASI